MKSDPSFVTIIVKMIQRALVLQGGGALGAYEMGAYKALCEKLISKDNSNGENLRKNRPLFDIIAGTSIDKISERYLKEGKDGEDDFRKICREI
ncbi:MAG: hypothetical protein GEU26_03155 [Nitrososphaeraceae archaeon]|nr:hypothetical protein [Nitrososphaeraceae archaeon]